MRSLASENRPVMSVRFLLTLFTLNSSMILSGCTGSFEGSRPSAPMPPLHSASFASAIGCPEPTTPPAGQIDALSYMRAPEGPSINQFQYSLGPNPEGGTLATFLLYKLGSREAYEVYHYDQNHIYLQFEVVKQGNWIRQFDETTLKGRGLGAIWSPRFVVPGQSGLLSTSAFDYSSLQNGKWVNVPAESRTGFPNYLTLHWAKLDWGGCQQANVLRLQQEWEDRGRIFEYYDYEKDKGIVHWQWNERLDYLMSRPGPNPGEFIGFWDQGKNVFIKIDTSTSPPKAVQVDRTTGKTRALPVAYWVSYFTGKPAWYVATREQPYLDEGISVSSRYPVEPVEDYQIGGGRTIANLPHLYTVSAATGCSGVFCTYLENLYAFILGRSPDSAGMQYWQSAIDANKLSCAGVATAFLHSSEFRSRQIKFGDREFVVAVFQGLLARVPESEAVKNAVSLLASRKWTRADYGKFVLRSTEFNSNCKTRYGFPDGAGTLDAEK